ncbi:hypothetical protein BT63DRAFT_2644 [Microthyrium microscopicum]|uniref:Cell polarity protein-like protein n=1 Tax=Microthyrium microscopicum TaxID=703497 RepID=A0A6A6UT52_9PEZI|nr:hypothetical protein BT63DRAFT_2644 [Microthyrium microscopicum]
MSFLWGKNKKGGPPGALPPATRDISSSHGISAGSDARGPLASGGPGPREGPMERRATVGNSQNPNGPLNASTSSMAPELGPGTNLIRARERAESDATSFQPRPGTSSGKIAPAPIDSPYPWSERRLQFSTNLSPFPRYGAAVNATASRWIYIMGGLVNSQTVKGDLWMIDLTNGAMACYPVNTVAEGPGPRVGHASLLVGNAFIVFGGDTKLEDGDVLDDTLYLLNTSSKQWARASPSGTRPSGRYGHTLNIVGSKIYIYGGQVEGFFFNDLVAFDLNTLQVAGNRWEILIQNEPTSPNLPAPRTNHSVISWQDRLYLFGGTDGTRWFNDVWTYDPATNLWTELDCIGYIPSAREGHSAALVNDVMYIFGGRVQDGTDLGDLVAFKISTRRWYMFQNMGMSPSPRSGHSMTAFGNHIIVLAGEPSSAPRDPAELSQAYILDTTKIRYPTSEPAPGPQQINATPAPGQAQLQSQVAQIPSGAMRKFSNDSGASAMAGSKPRSVATLGSAPESRSESPLQNGNKQPVAGARSIGTTTPVSLQPKIAAHNKIQDASALRAKTPSRSGTNAQYERDTISPTNTSGMQSEPQVNGTYAVQQPQSKSASSVPSRTGSRQQPTSIDSDNRDTPRASVDTPATNYSREIEPQVDSGIGSSPAIAQQNEELAKELEAAKSRNAWYASELALARKAGYQPNSSGNPILDQQAAEVFGDDDRPLIEALLKMKAELTRVQGSIDSQSGATATRIAEIEKQRDVAISEAAYAKAKLAAHGGSSSQIGTPQPDTLRGSISPENDRSNDMSRRLAHSLNNHKELNSKIESLATELESERRARAMAEDTADAAEQRISDLDAYKQRTAGELESLRAELHEVQKAARQEAANAAEAIAAHKLLEADKNELTVKHSRAIEDSQGHTTILDSLRQAVTASTEKADHLERKLDEERQLRTETEQKFAAFKVEHEQRSGELEGLSRRLEDAESLAQRHAEEARTHREAVLSGLGAVASRSMDDSSASDSRVEILTQQLESANVMARQNQDAADLAAERLRRAEERIAGLEAYQEQTTRENLTIRKQAQLAMKELQLSHADKSEAQQRLERSLLDSNALEVQLKTLKHLLDERGINAADVRRSRVLESPSSRYGTPDLNRIRELEQQLDDSVKAHDEMRQVFETREQEVAREWEEKLAALSSDHQGTIKYVRGLEKIFNKMKAEVQRYKSVNAELEKELEATKGGAVSRSVDGASGAEWEKERNSMRKQMTEMEDSVKTSMVALESQISGLKKSLAETEADREQLRKAHSEHEVQINQLHSTARGEIENMQREKQLLEARAIDAERKVQMFLDQFETSVDNYRRLSRLEQQMPRATGSMSGPGGDADSIYSTTTAEEDEAEDTETEESGKPKTGAAGKKSRDRTSMALDSLTTELESLRSKWETTRGNYKLNDKFEFEKPSAPGSASFPSWARAMDTDTESIESQESAERLIQTPNKKPSSSSSQPLAPKSIPTATHT